MSHTRRNRARPDAHSGRAVRLGWCHACNKQTFRSRKAARANAKAVFPNEKLNAYPCPAAVDQWQWHYGHLREGDR